MFRRRTGWLVGLIFASLAFFADQARADVLYDNVGGGGFQDSLVSQDFEAAFNQMDTRGADDFTVPQGEEWFIDTVAVAGKHLGAPAVPTAFRVAFFEDNGELPGSEIAAFESNGGPYPAKGQSATTAIPLGVGPQLGPGEYWVSVQAIMDSHIDVPNEDASRWFWGVKPAGHIGSSAVFENPGAGFNEFTCTSFAPLKDCSSNPGIVDADFAFRLDGATSVTAECAAATNAVATANGSLTTAKSALSRAKAALTKAQKAVKKAQSKLKSAKGKRAKLKAKTVLRKSKKKATAATASVKKAKKKVGSANAALSTAKTNQSSVC